MTDDAGDTRPTAVRPIIVHHLGHASTALAAAVALGCPVVLASAPGAGAYAGAGWFLALVRQARAAFPVLPPPVTVTAWLDCGDQPGTVLAALRAGCTHVRFTGRADVAARLADIAEQTGAVLMGDAFWGPALDLRRATDADAACRAWLTGQTGRDE